MCMTTTPHALPDPADLTLPDEDRRALIGWAADCIWRLLPIFRLDRPSDDRLEKALVAAAEFHSGNLPVGPMRKVAFACHAAARDCNDAAATAVARACGQAAAIAHMGGHARNIGRYTCKALAGVALAEELEWQRVHLPLRFHEYVFNQ